jgi:uncharacterized protein involved in high-affinity Fe2+ transport
VRLIGFAKAIIATAVVASWSTTAFALEYPIGKPQTRAGMEIAAVYLQPVTMEPKGMMREAAASDIHMEADIRALADNPNGFAEGEWIPYLRVRYEIAKRGGNAKISGKFMPMVASDGPHYGDNIKLIGPGRYRVKYFIAPPGEYFGRHTDRDTGVQPWFKPFEVEYEFTYAGVGKKGGY